MNTFTTLTLIKMKIICINKNKGGIDKTMNNIVSSFYNKKLTIGKTYEILKYDNVDLEPFRQYFIADDGSELLYFDNDTDFITLEQWRNNQLNQILS